MAVPKRELFKAADVCEVVQVQPYVLRSWEAEFPQIGQAPAGGGPRVYRRADVAFVLRIKQLILEEGLTLSGARRRLDEEADQQNPEASEAALSEEVFGDQARESLRMIRSGLQSILELLSKGGEQQPELELVAPAAPKKKTVAKTKRRS